MQLLQTIKSKALVGMVAVAAMVAAGASSAQAAVVRGVHVTKGAGWVRVTIDAPGGSFSVREMPVDRAADYRSIAIDIPGASIVGGLEPKSRVAVNEGLVSQVRVRQMGGSVRVLVDVIAFPRYRTYHEGSALVVGLDTYHMRDGAPDKPRMHGAGGGGGMLAGKGGKCADGKSKADCCCSGKKKM